MSNLKILDAAGTTELVVGMRLEDDAFVSELGPEGDGEGGPPIVIIGFERVGDRPWSYEEAVCRPLDYRREGPDYPYNWVCDEAVLEAAPREAGAMSTSDGLGA